MIRVYINPLRSVLVTNDWYNSYLFSGGAAKNFSYQVISRQFQLVTGKLMSTADRLTTVKPKLCI